MTSPGNIDRSTPLPSSSSATSDETGPMGGEGDSVDHRVEIDFPGWVVERLDREAGRIGVTRDALLKVWVAEWLDDRRSSELTPRS